MMSSTSQSFGGRGPVLKFLILSFLLFDTSKIMKPGEFSPKNGVAQLAEHRQTKCNPCRRTDGGSIPPIVPNSNFTDMKNKTTNMNLSIVDAFKNKFPDLDIKTPTWAVLGVTAEFRKLQVGDIVLFPIDSYNYQTIRSTPGTSMVPEVLNEGRQWKTKLDRDNKSVAVLRIA